MLPSLSLCPYSDLQACLSRLQGLHAASGVHARQTGRTAGFQGQFTHIAGQSALTRHCAQTRCQALTGHGSLNPIPPLRAGALTRLDVSERCCRSPEPQTLIARRHAAELVGPDGDADAAGRVGQQLLGHHPRHVEPAAGPAGAQPVQRGAQRHAAAALALPQSHAAGRLAQPAHSAPSRLRIRVSLSLHDNPPHAAAAWPSPNLTLLDVSLNQLTVCRQVGFVCGITCCENVRCPFRWHTDSANPCWHQISLVEGSVHSSGLQLPFWLKLRVLPMCLLANGHCSLEQNTFCLSQGTFSLIGNFSLMRILSADNNDFNGTVPGGLVGRMRRLGSLTLSNNTFDGRALSVQLKQQ